jgi:hypothetical protein
VARSPGRVGGIAPTTMSNSGSSARAGAAAASAASASSAAKHRWAARGSAASGNRRRRCGERGSGRAVLEVVASEGFEAFAAAIFGVFPEALPSEFMSLNLEGFAPFVNEMGVAQTTGRHRFTLTRWMATGRTNAYPPMEHEW